MLKTKEGEIAKCAICKMNMVDDRFFIITKVTKKVPSFPCPKCGKPIIIERDVSRATTEIEKDCKCPLVITDEVLADAKPKWEEKHFPICEKCFKVSFGSVLFLELGDD